MTSERELLYKVLFDMRGDINELRRMMENKSMKTDATVKNYGMEIIGDGGERLKGYWTGGVNTKVKNS